MLTKSLHEGPSLVDLLYEMSFDPRHRWRNLPVHGTSSAVPLSSQPDNASEVFKKILDVQQFRPNELKVRVVDRFLVIEAKHEERPDEHGFVSREFIRRYQLPSNVNPTDISSSLSSDGFLTVFACKKDEAEQKSERTIPINHIRSPTMIRQPDKRQKLDTE